MKASGRAYPFASSRRFGGAARDWLGERQITIRAASGSATFIRLRPRVLLGMWLMALALAAWSVFAFLHVIEAPEARRAEEARLARAQGVWEERVARAASANAALRARLEASRARFEAATVALERRQDALEALTRRQARAATRLEALRQAEAERLRAPPAAPATGAGGPETTRGGGAGGRATGDESASALRIAPMVVGSAATTSRPPSHRIAGDVTPRPLDALLAPDFAGALAQVAPVGAQVPERLLAVDLRQRRILSRLEEQTSHALVRLEGVAREAGLAAAEHIAARVLGAKQGGMGGAFRHAPRDAGPVSAFELQRRRVEGMIERLETLDVALSSLPLAAPMDEAALTSPYGVRVDPILHRLAFHEGLDFTTAEHGAIYSPLPGVASRVANLSDYGITVVIDHGAGITTLYGHLREATVKKGERIPFRGLIGYMGSTGRSTGPHLHYEIRIDGEAVDPAPYIAAGRRAFQALDARL